MGKRFCARMIIDNMVFLELDEAEKIIRMLNRKYHIEPSDAKGCRNWVNFAKTKNFEPYKKLIPKRPDIYYKKGNVHYEKLLKANRAKRKKDLAEFNRKSKKLAKILEKKLRKGYLGRISRRNLNAKKTRRKTKRKN